jgi:hypothetical protein
MISYTQRNVTAKHLAGELYSSLLQRGYTVWQDVRMGQLNSAAMKEGAQNSRCVIAVVTGPVTREKPGKDEQPEDNAFFRRNFCVGELRRAKDAGVPIQPVLRADDKTRIGEFLGLAPADLQYLGSTADFIHMDDSRPAFWEAGISEILRLTNLPAAEALPLQLTRTRRAHSYTVDVDYAASDSESTDCRCR